MTQEEKAKRYDEALKEAVIAHKDEDRHLKATLERIFPELKESEDERMIQYFKDLAPFDKADELYEKYGFSHKDAIAWLEKQAEHANFRNKIQIGDKVTRNEDGVLVNLSQLNRVAKKDDKQGEQKPADNVDVLMSLDEAIEHCKEKSCGNNACALEHKQLEKWLTELKELKEQKSAWSEEDGKIVEGLVSKILANYNGCSTINGISEDRVIDWLKSLRNRVKPQPDMVEALRTEYEKGRADVISEMKSSWSEEDEEIHRKCICAMRASACGFPEEEKFVEQVDNWLKSLKERYTWKPSDEQMIVLNDIIINGHLSNAKEILKKLREE